MSRLPVVNLRDLPPGQVPLYIELQDQLRSFLDTAGDISMLPPERTLASAYGVSRITVRKALKSLKDEGRIAGTRGRGTAVIQKAS